MAKVQIVTGGTQGMGLATAIELAKMYGGPIVVGGRNEARCAKAVEELKAAGLDGYGFTCDVSDKASLAAFADQAAGLGEIGNVVNAAGLDFDVATIPDMVKVNMGGVVNFTNEFFPRMSAGSTLVNYSSITGYFLQPNEEDLAVWADPDADDFLAKAEAAINKHENPMPGRLPDTYPCYGLTKSFVMKYTMANAARFGAQGKRILSFAPGSFATPMLEHQAANMDSIVAGTAFKRPGKPEEMGKFIASCLDPDLEYLTGVDLVMDGGKMAMALTKQLA